MTATRLDRLTVVVRSGKTATRYENYLGKVPGFASRFITWLEAGVVKKRKKITPKIGDRVLTCMFVVYNTDSGCTGCGIKIQIVSTAPKILFG